MAKKTTKTKQQAPKGMMGGGKMPKGMKHGKKGC